jgi:hypothetical protein
MNVPQSQNLHSQSFNSEFVEFVWRIPHDKSIHKKFLLHVEKDLSIYMTSEWIPADDNQLGFTNVTVFDRQCKLDTLEEEMLNPKNWDVGTLPHGYNYFSNGKDLVELVKESIEYLK